MLFKKVTTFYYENHKYLLTRKVHPSSVLKLVTELPLCFKGLNSSTCVVLKGIEFSVQKLEWQKAAHYLRANVGIETCVIIRSY
jgi:hypothetical protein